MSLEISRQVHDEYKEVFMYFSEEARTQGDKAKIGTDEFTTMVRSLGYAPTQAELKGYCSIIDETYGGFLSFDQFVLVMATVVTPQQASKPDPDPAIRKAFSVFGTVCRDGASPNISMQDLEYLMTRRGEKLNSAEFRHMQRAAKPQYGSVQHERLLAALSSEAATADVPQSAGSPAARSAKGGAAASAPPAAQALRL